MPYRCPDCGQFLSTREFGNPASWNPTPVYELYCKRCGWEQREHWGLPHS
jgi:hypothetical protein